MKTELLKNLIKEAVREVLKEELKELLSETNKPVENYLEKTPVHKVNTFSNVQKNSITEMLNMTQQSMTRDDYRNVIQSEIEPGMNTISMTSKNIPSNLPSGPHPGLDISKLDFVKNAAAVYNKAKEKDNFKVGG